MEMDSKPKIFGTALIESIRVAFHHSGQAALLSQISIDIEENRVVIRGRLSRFYLKQLAQTIVMQVEGVERIRNEIEVLAE